MSDWGLVAGVIGTAVLSLVAGIAWGIAYGYRRGMAGRPTLIDPISKFLKGQDEKRASAEEKAWERRTDALLPAAQVREMEAKPIPLMGGNQAQRVQANRPGRDPDTFGFIRPSRKTRSDAGKRRGTPIIGSWARVMAVKRAPKGWRTLKVLTDGRRIVEPIVKPKAPAKRQGKAATPGKAKGKARTARKGKGRPVRPQQPRKGTSKGRRG